MKMSYRSLVDFAPRSTALDGYEELCQAQAGVSAYRCRYLTHSAPGSPIDDRTAPYAEFTNRSCEIYPICQLTEKQAALQSKIDYLGAGRVHTDRVSVVEGS